MNKIRIGIIGTGFARATQIPSFLANGAEVVSVASGKLANAEKTAREFNIKHFTDDWRETVKRDDVDLISVVTPPVMHREMTLAAIACGKHVLCEKPMATNLADAKRVLDAANNSTAVFQVGHNRRYAPVYVKLKELLKDDKPHSAHIKMNRGELQNPEWTSDVAITGGFLYETTIHLFDMMRFQFGEIAEMIATGSSHTYPETDNFSVLLKFRSGLHATFCSSAEASWSFPFERVEVFCEHRTILTQEMENITDNRGTAPNHEHFSFHPANKEERWGYAQEDAAFIDAILNQTAPPVTAFDGFKSVELVEACYKAVKTGERIVF